MKRLKRRRFVSNISANLGVGLIVGSVLFPLSADTVTFGKFLFALITFVFGAILIAAAVILFTYGFGYNRKGYMVLVYVYSCISFWYGFIIVC